jgi:hypothetical protein
MVSKYRRVIVNGLKLETDQRVTIKPASGKSGVATVGCLRLFVPLREGHDYAVVAVSEAGGQWKDPSAVLIALPSSRLEPHQEKASPALLERLNSTALALESSVVDTLQKSLSRHKPAAVKSKKVSKQQSSDNNESDASPAVDKHVFADVWCDNCGNGEIKDVAYECWSCKSTATPFDLCGKCAAKNACGKDGHPLLRYLLLSLTTPFIEIILCRWIKNVKGRGRNKRKGFPCQNRSCKHWAKPFDTAAVRFVLAALFVSLNSLSSVSLLP